ncbi:lysozyme inhibitor LprI family protein [Citrobacter werkmanii]|uniref:lysozyme inhibitor LprI family protein n=1 Tax=Citrobacter werkmanii TaxID=67827 RepID=UPI0034D772CC
MNTSIKKMLLILSLTICSISYAASFDCKQAKSNTEKMICSNYKLNRLDDFLDKNYKIAMKSAMPDNVKSRIKQSQVEWLGKRDTCGDAQCVQDMYSKRIDYLWDECFDYIRGRIEYVKYTEAMDVINKEENAKNNKSPEDIIKSFSVKHGGQIHDLGYTESQLKSTIFINLDGYVKYSTLENYLSLMYELPGFKSLDKINYKDYLGFRIKISGQPYTGFVLREEDEELYLSGLVSGNEVIEPITVRDVRGLSSVFMSYASYAINKDKFNP